MREKGREVASTTEDSKMGECGERARERESKRARERWGPHHKRIKDVSMAVCTCLKGDG